jgi:hypothetical protein
MPLPLAAQERLGQILQMLPTFSLVIVAPTGGKEMKMGMVLLSGVGFFREVFIMIKRFEKRAILLLG